MPLLPAAIFLAAFCAFVISAIAGGGAGLVLLPLLRLIVPIRGVPAALTIGTATGSLSRIVVFRRSIRWDVVRCFVPFAIPGTLGGVLLLAYLQPAYVDFCVALFLLANVGSLFRRTESIPDVAPTMSVGFVPIIAVLAGLLSGLTGAVGLVFNALYTKLGMSREEIVATRAMNEVFMHFVKLVLYASLGLFTRATLCAGAIVALAAILASFATKYILPKIDERNFRRIGIYTIVASGIVMLSISSREIASIQKAWLQVVASDEGHEMQLYLHGALRFAIEKDARRGIVLEKSVPFQRLPPQIRSRIDRRIDPRSILSIEKVRNAQTHVYEILYTDRNRMRSLEIPY